MLYLIYIFIFLFGLIIGSFLNVVIYRLEVNKSAFRGRSFCPKCKHILAWYDLVPLFSFIWLKGKCRYCGEKISIQYPMVELAAGFLFLGIFYSVIASIVPLCGTSEAISSLLYGWFLFSRDCFVASLLAMTASVYWFYVISVLIIIFVYDLKHYIIPDKIILPAIAVSLFWSLGFSNYLEIISRRLTSLGLGNYQPGADQPWAGKLEIIDIDSLLAAFGAAGFFFLLILISRGKGMGFGDVKLAFLMGLVLGYPQILSALFTAVVAGAIIGVGLIILNKKTLKSQIPFGPFLVGGTVFSLFFGEIIFNWYWNIFL